MIAAASQASSSAPCGRRTTKNRGIHHTPVTSVAEGGTVAVLAKITDESKFFPQVFFRYESSGGYKEPLDMKPSEYVRRNLWATFQDDPIGPMLFRYFGEDNFMWASDFPHTDSTWPNSLKVIEQDFEGVPDAVKRKIICDNAAKLYNIDLN